jgi:tRNA threonylcarbamoyladenosine biosynthesis protein TsaE
MVTTGTFATSSPEETMELGRKLGAILKGGEVVSFEGPLGAGKTTMIKGIASALGVCDTSAVRSPTFVIVREYEGVSSEGKELSIHHMDAYRLEGGEDFDDLGGRDLMDDGSILLVEWADRILPGLPAERICVSIEHMDPTTRKIEIK